MDKINDNEHTVQDDHFFLFIEFCIILLSIPNYHLEQLDENIVLNNIKVIWSDYLGKNIRKLSNAPEINDSHLLAFKDIFKTANSTIGIEKFEKDLKSEISIAKYRIDIYQESEVKYTKVIISEKSFAFFKPFANLDEDLLRH